MKEKNIEKPKRKAIDRVRLILTALGVSFCLFVFLMFLALGNVQEEWIVYILVSIIYIVIFIHGFNKNFGLKRRINDLLSFLLLASFTFFPIILGCMIFYFRILHIPKKIFTYFIFLILLLPTAIVGLNECLKLHENRKISRKKKSA